MQILLSSQNEFAREVNHWKEKKYHIQEQGMMDGRQFVTLKQDVTEPIGAFWKFFSMIKENGLGGDDRSTITLILKESKTTTIQNPLADSNPPSYQQVVDDTSPFIGYGIVIEQKHPLNGVVLSGVSIRPSNMLFEDLFKDSNIVVSLPGTGKLFAFNQPHSQIREYLNKKVEHDPEGIVEVSAKGKPGFVLLNKGGNERKHVEDLSELYGDKVYEISYQEIIDTLESQHIYTSSLLPLEFYRGLKASMKADQMVILPGFDGNPFLLSDLEKNQHSHVAKFLATVKLSSPEFGFSDKSEFESLLKLTLYQIGAMVVKIEDFRFMVDGKGKILERKAGQNDAVRLINACGIRGIHSKRTPQEHNLKIMRETFKAAFAAAENGIVIFPAVGMGVWGGDPELYWRAFLDAVMDVQDNFDAIYVNPGHQKTPYGRYQGCNGNEFETMLNEYLQKANDPNKLAKLQKVNNLFSSKKDVVQLAHHFKVAFPDKIVSLFNASDPDVTLGNHVGEYVNNMPHGITTEENYTAGGTNGLCFEGITLIHEDSSRLHQVGRFV